MEIDIRSIGELLDLLVTADISTYLAQDDIRDENLTPEQRLKAAYRAQEGNARRNKLIRKIDERLGNADASPPAKSYDR